MRVLLTGGNAFVSRALGPALLSAKHEVTVCVRAASQLADWIDEGVSQVVEADLANAGIMALLNSAPEAIIHAAGRLEDPDTPLDLFMRDNFKSTRNLVALANAGKTRKFIYFSSISIHGSVHTTEIDETTRSIEPTPYGLSKRMAEKCLAGQKLVPAVSIRLPGIVGPEAQKNWLSRCRADLRANKPVKISNPDFPFNNVLHSADLAMFVLSLLDRNWSNFHAFPVGASAPMTIATMVETMKNACGSSSETTIVGGGRTPFSISTAYAEKNFGYIPATVDSIISRFCLTDD